MSELTGLCSLTLLSVTYVPKKQVQKEFNFYLLYNTAPRLLLTLYTIIDS